GGNGEQRPEDEQHQQCLGCHQCLHGCHRSLPFVRLLYTGWPILQSLLRLSRNCTLGSGTGLASRRGRFAMRPGLWLCCLSLISGPAFAQTDEIQVYDAHIAPKGVFNLTLHDNYIASGGKTPAFPGGLVPNHSFNGVPEWAYGVASWFEAGL